MKLTDNILAANGRFCRSEVGNERARRGFTMVEMLMALVILVLMTGIVAMGIPSAFKTYTGAVNASNAQVLIATTSTALRDELSSAQGVEKVGNNVYYQDSEGLWALLQVGSAVKTDQGTLTIKKQMYRRTVGDNGAPSDFVATSEAVKLVSDAAVTDALGVTFGSIDYSDGVFIIKNLRVVDKDGNTIVKTGNDTDNFLKIPAVMLKEG